MLPSTMSSDSLFTSNQVLSASTFNQLLAAMQAIAQSVSQEALIITEVSLLSLGPLEQEACLKQEAWLKEFGMQRFCLVVSPGFSGLLLAKVADFNRSLQSGATDLSKGDRGNDSDGYPHAYETCLSFDPAAIAPFLLDLQRHVSPASDTCQQIKSAHQELQPNEPQWQSQFSLKLAAVLASGAPMPGTMDATHGNVHCHAGSDGGDRSGDFGTTHPRLQAEQERVFSQIATQIRQTQELSLILEATIQKVRSLLNVDRLAIYQFEAGMEPSSDPSASQDAPQPQTNELVCGRITYETRAHSSIRRILNLSEGVQCFIGIPDYKEKYCNGTAQAITDIQSTYFASPCLIKLLEWAQVKAKLVVPIVVQENLWGLLIAHQCSHPRQWQDSEIHFMRYVAELMAIAIYQTQLYGQLQQQAQVLEQQFIERTQELHDALSAVQAASLAKTEFLASISHELRTPLTAIIGMSATLLRLPTDARREQLIPPEKQQDYLKIIRNSGEHLLELINDILDLSQVEAGKTILDVREFSLTRIASESLKLLGSKAQEKGVALELDMQLGNPAVVAATNCDRFAADPRRVQQILLNLLSNAIKFTSAGGRVTLRIWVTQGNAILQIEDTGIGIPEHQFPLLFKRFQQLDTSYHRQYGGTGLGLALTRQLVELHGGQIQVESTVDVGSVFTVYLPAQSLPAQSSKDGKRQSPGNSGNILLQGRVVLLESHEATATLLCELLTAAGHQVVWMIDGMTAIQQIELLKPEVVVVDTQLAGMGIDEFLQRLRQNPVTQSMKVLVLAEEKNESCDRWLKAGADDVSLLPIEHPEVLLDQVTYLMNHHLYSPQN